MTIIYPIPRWIICLAMGLVLAPGLMPRQAHGQGNPAAPDWNGYTPWQNTTQYTRTHVVNQRHPAASDQNPGTEDLPLLTINHAAQLAQPGERVLIHSGVYREMIRPKQGGTGPSAMISYEAAPGAQVTIKGSKRFAPQWFQRSVYTDAIPDTTLTYTWSRRVWVGQLPDSLFDDGYYPFQLPNIEPHEFKIMFWTHLLTKLPPFISPRGVMWQNGQRMKQVEAYADVARVEGSFWVDRDGRTVHIHAFGGGNPNAQVFEVGTRSHLFKPQQLGTGYVQVQGLTFEHCANGFMRSGTGAVTIMGGHHWIIQGNTIRENNSSGLEFGFNAFEWEDPNPENIYPRPDEEKGGIIVRNNHIYNCGTAGIRSYQVLNTFVLNNHIHHCGWQDAENYWECSGIKILVARTTLVAGNHIHDIQGGNGIWLDWDIQHSRVTRNIIHDIQNIQGGIFIEASHLPNLVDHNFIWNIDGHGIYGNDSDELLIHHNLVANTTGPVVNAIVATQRRAAWGMLTANRNTVSHNLFINPGAPVRFQGEDNVTDHNWYVTTQPPAAFSLASVQAEGQEAHGNALLAGANFARKNLYFHWRSSDTLPQYPVLKGLMHDFYGQPRTGSNTVPGPFGSLEATSQYLLNEAPNNPTENPIDTP